MTVPTFELFDTRDNRRVSVAVYFDEQRAWEAIERIRALVHAGNYRQDIADDVAFYSVRPLDNDSQLG